MAQMVKTVVYDAPEKDVLLNPDNAFEIGVQVGNTGVEANENGRKIILAGTPVGSTQKVLQQRTTILQVIKGGDAGDTSNAQGVLRHDVDVTDGAANGTLIVRGEIDLSKTPFIDETIQDALPHIIFVNGGK